MTAAFYYEPAVKEKLGMTAAIIFSHLNYWKKRNEKKKTNIFEGRCWVHQSYEQLAELVGVSRSTIIRIIQKLIDAGFLLKKDRITNGKSKSGRNLYYSTKNHDEKNHDEVENSSNIEQQTEQTEQTDKTEQVKEPLIDKIFQKRAENAAKRKELIENIEKSKTTNQSQATSKKYTDEELANADGNIMFELFQTDRAQWQRAMDIQMQKTDEIMQKAKLENEKTQKRMEQKSIFTENEFSSTTTLLSNFTQKFTTPKKE